LGFAIYLESPNNSEINILTEEELTTISELREAYGKYNVAPCTSCGYCKPCPNGVSIPFILGLLNDLAYSGESGKERIFLWYNYLVKSQEEIEKKKSEGEKSGGAAILCIQCGECLDKCPQQIDIPDFMEKANEIFENGKKISEILF